MKELSIEEKAKRYDDVVSKLGRFMAQGVNPLITRADVQDFFPELAESEDERIRQALIEHFKWNAQQVLNEFANKKVLAWLEKQGEHANFRNKIQIGDKVTRNEDGVLVNLSQLKRVAKKVQKQGEKKSTECSSEQSKTLQTDDVPYESSPNAHLWTRAIGFDGEPMESKPCEQNSAWSEKDDEVLDSIIEEVRYIGDFPDYPTKEENELYDECLAKVEWLKSLKERCTWKPSDAQMASITCTVRKMKESACYDSELVSLLNDLKKLKG